MFSARTAGERGPNPLTEAIERVGARHDLVDLTVSNPTQVDLPIDRAAVAEALAAGAKAAYAPEALGIERARVAIADYYGRRGVPVDPAHVFVTASTSEAYTHVLRLLADPGEAVLAHQPGYPLFEALAGVAGVALDHHRLAYEGRWRLDPAAMQAELHTRTRALSVINPGNPTGSVLGVVDRRRLLTLAAERGLALIADEVFLDYLEQPELFARHSFARTGEVLTFTLSGLSKVAALPHLKLSWGVVSGPEAEVAEAMGRLEVALDAFLSASTPVQEALPTLLEGAEDLQAHLRDRLLDNRRALFEAAQAAGLELRAADGGWAAILALPAGADDEAAAIELVEAARVITQPGYLYDLEDAPCLVLSLLPAPETFAEGLEALFAGLSDIG